QLAEEQLLCLDDMAALDGAADTNPGLPVGDDQLIYMIYTSGSTGRPKGSLLYHRGFKNLVSWYVEEFGFDADTRVLHMTSPAFDLTQKNLFAPLVSGGRLCLLNSRVYDAGIIVDHIEQHRITALNCTPSAFGRLLSFGDEALYRRLQSLRYVFLGGEPIVVARLKAWLDNPLCQAQVINTYGPTECTDVVAYYRIEQPADFIDRNVPIGRALPGFRLEVLDAQLQPLPAAQPGQDGPREDRGGPEGQLAIAGIGVGAGYHGKPELTAASFVADPRSAEPGARIYLTGDRARVLADGNIDYLGRIDNQVKVRGFRIELGEIERVLEQQPAIREAAVTVFPDRVGDNRLAAYLVWDPEQARPSISDVRGALQQSLPDFMLPTAWVTLERLPLTPNGKLDRRALPEPQARRPVLDVDYVAPASPVEQYLVALWLEYLGLDRIGIDDRFFELGGSSLNAVDFIARLSRELDERIPIATFFGAPTIRSFSAVLWAEHRAAMLQKFPGEAPALAAAGATVAAGRAAVASDEPIAIIGLAGRFPGAADADALWQNLLDGVEAVQRASDEDLRAAGVAEEDIADPDYVRHFFSMDDVAYFDAAFFGYQPREVESMDPQHRLFLELAWTALDNAGYADTESYPGRIGVFGGIARDAYLHHYVARHPRYRDALGEFAVNMGNDKNFPCTRVAYKLNLRGPAVNVQTACSTSGVALHLACQSLRLGESDMALVGGCRVLVPTRSGYRYVEGSALSRDGRLHVFDRRGTGMVRGSGGAMLVVKRLADALRDGDCIRALVKATAINNDGSAKVGFTAPSVEGQSAVISEALQRADVSPDSIGYVEAHGTATALGDPIEVRGLTRAYRQWTEARQFAALGSIKSNIGHLDAGAAAAGIVKVVFAMENGELPASLNYSEPNPDIEFARTPLRVQAERAPWRPAPGQPLRAGVSSFGLGGTNFHGVLEQAPPLDDRPDSAPGEGRPWQLLTLSAKTEGALTANIAGLHRYRAQYPGRAVADLAYSLNRFRPGFSRRAFLLCASDASPGPDAVALLRQSAVGEQPALVFAFPARRGPLRNAAPDLFRSERVFREAMQACGDGAATWLDRDLCASLYPLADADALADPLFADVAQFS
ncbi:MAG: beta-ketoacyl synthase N-terminal-like domain-containing protein, partial [Spongiibacteraceae bacterium]|nr:beta-ketoacyl synthase N-terminal-like domain-containing protein [Spongiibacteraceae bacterium]